MYKYGAKYKTKSKFMIVTYDDKEYVDVNIKVIIIEPLY